MLADEVRFMIQDLDCEDKSFLGGIPFTVNISRELSNYRAILHGQIPKRKRFNFGVPYSCKDRVIGYASFTLYSNASPSKYEKEVIGLENLDYLQFRSLAVSRYFRLKGVGTNLIRFGVELSDRLEMNSLGDIKKENVKIYNLLRKFSFKEGFIWQTPKGTDMLRMIRNN